MSIHFNQWANDCDFMFANSILSPKYIYTVYGSIGVLVHWLCINPTIRPHPRYVLLADCYIFYFFVFANLIADACYFCSTHHCSYLYFNDGDNLSELNLWRFLCCSFVFKWTMNVFEKSPGTIKHCANKYRKHKLVDGRTFLIRKRILHVYFIEFDTKLRETDRERKRRNKI